MSQFALVRHSAYTVGANPDFENAVEVSELNTHQAYLVRAAGAAVFTTAETAQAAADAANFPHGRTRAAPDAPGYFANLRIGGAEIYIPRATSDAARSS